MTIARKPLLLAIIFVAVAPAAPALYALEGEDLSGSTMGGRMMSGRHMMGMAGMGRTMNGCAAMMQGHSGIGRPNDQWRNQGSPEGHE